MYRSPVSGLRSPCKRDVEMVSKFEDLEVWKRAARLAVDVYKMFSDCKDFGFKDQVTRSALSVASNIGGSPDLSPALTNRSSTFHPYI